MDSVLCRIGYPGWASQLGADFSCLFRLIHCVVFSQEIVPGGFYPASGRSGLLHQKLVTGAAFSFRVRISLIVEQRSTQSHVRDSNIEVACRKRIGVEFERVPEELL